MEETITQYQISNFKMGDHGLKIASREIPNGWVDEVEPAHEEALD
jgi:hypothetical protein